MTDSILEGIKTSLGIPRDHLEFDGEVLLHLNSALSLLAHIGVGPTNGVYVTGYDETWDELMGGDHRLGMARSYIAQKVKLAFDPPEIGFVLTSIKETLSEYEWRLNIIADEETP